MIGRCPVCAAELADPDAVAGPPFPAAGDFAICSCLAILRYRPGAAAGELGVELVELDELDPADRVRVERARDRVAWAPDRPGPAPPRPRRPRGTGADE